MAAAALLRFVVLSVASSPCSAVGKLRRRSARRTAFPVASSIVGTLQNIAGAGGALLAAVIYDGSVGNSVIIMATVGLLATLIFLMRPLIAPGPLVHHPDELARD